MNTSVLPDPSGFFEIRFESIGGLGAHAAGQILARAAVLKMNFNGAHFSSYGSEKKGSPVRSYVRLGAADKPIRTSAPIDSPDAIVVFHSALMEQDITLAGMKNTGTLIFNGAKGDIPKILESVPAGTKIVRIDATNIAIEELSRPNAVLLGTLTTVVPFLDSEIVLNALTEKFRKRNPLAAASNERAFKRGAQEFEVLEGVGKGKGDLPVIRPSPVLGYETAPIGGVIPYAGNTVSNDLSASRTGWMPLFKEDECIHCGLCATVCPDFCLTWTHERTNGELPTVRLKGIDYQYCKGCMRCIETCPTEAMTRVSETPGLADQLRVPLFLKEAIMATEIHAALQDPGNGEHAGGIARQSTDFLSGNEAAARAASDIGFHVMGYFPITPSTEVAETLSKMQANGEHEIVMIPADGEHGAAGICYGAALGGGRVLNATSSQGLLYALEQLPVQSSTRVPMVLNVATRAISGPLDIKCDHSDIYFALNTGWIILLAREPQAVYDMNLAAIRIGEHADVRLPVIVAYDGFFTSHQKRRVECIEDHEALQNFLGTPETPYTALDPEHPVTFGPYMNDPDLINNKKQHSLAMEAARRVIPEVFEELAELTGRRWPVLDAYHMEDAEVAVVMLNSAAETAKEVADRFRRDGHKVGVLSPNVLRPFPADLIREYLSGVKAIVVGDRADSYGADGGNLSLEVRAAIQVDPDNRTRVLTRIYGLGGKDFDDGDAAEFFSQALEVVETGRVDEAFAYHGTYAGDPEKAVAQGLPAIEKSEVTRNMATVTQDSETGKLNVELKPLWAMAEVPGRIAPGHGACPGCGAFPVLNQVFSVLEGDIVVLYQTGCAMVVTTGYPKTAHRVTYIHNLFQNGAATMSGLVEMYHELKRRGEIPDSRDITFVMVSGDGGMDIGMGSALGAAHRNHHMMILEYDNQGYMNTGAQLSYSTPLGHRTSTSEVGSIRKGKISHHKDTPQIFAAAHIPYVFTASEGYPEDLMRKAAKAQWYAKNEGLSYGKILSFCPLNWTTTDDAAEAVLQVAIDSCFFPIYEVERGKTNITYDPELLGRRRKITDWLSQMGKTKHLMAEGNEQRLAAIEEEAERRWRRIKAMHEHPEL